MPFLVQLRDFAGRPHWHLFAERPRAEHERARLTATPPIAVPDHLADAPLDTIIAALVASAPDPFPQELDP